MKTNTIAAFLFMILIVLYPLVNGIQVNVSPDMSRFIPEDSLLYLEQQKVSLIFKEFSRSPLGKKIESIPFIETGRKIGVSDSVLEAVQGLLYFYTKIKNDKLFHEIFGKSFALAILPPTESSEHSSTVEYFYQNTVVVAKPKNNLLDIESLAKTYTKYGGLPSISKTLYGTHLIKRFQLFGHDFSLAIVEDFFLMSFNEKQLRRCIDTFDMELPTLAKKDNFMKIRKSIEKPDRFFYLPVDEARNFIVNEFSKNTFTAKELVIKELATTIGFDDFGHGSWNNKKSVVGKAVALYHNEKVNSVVKEHILTQPTKNSMLSFVTKNPMAYYWSNTIKIEHLLRYLLANREDGPRYENFSASIENVIYRNLDSLLPLLDEEISIVLEPGLKENFVSIPRGILFVQVKSIPAIRSVFEKILEDFKIKLTMQSYAGIQYSYWTPSPQDGLQPLYGFWGNNVMFFANSPSLLQMIVDRKSKKSLMGEPVFKGCDPGFAQKNNSVIYLNNVEIIKVMQKLLNLLAMTLAIEDRTAATKMHTTIDEIISPLLEGVSMYDRMATRSYFLPGMVVIDSITMKKTPLTKRAN